jgi:predicted metal-dependent phosphoesterase TrpH
MIRADFHIHSEYSFDSDNKLEDIIRRCRDTGIDCIAIADHGTAEGGLKIQDMAPFPVIVAEEILTPRGEIMGMFLKETIPTNIPIDEAIARIREQDGLVNIPHPFDILTRKGLGEETMLQIIDDIDIIEVFNARTTFPGRSGMARTFAEKHGKARSAGSDAHTINEIGKTCIEMPEFTGKDDFLQALGQGTIYRHTASPFVHFGSLKARLRFRKPGKKT